MAHKGAGESTSKGKKGQTKDCSYIVYVQGQIQGGGGGVRWNFLQKGAYPGAICIANKQVVSPASLLDSQHGCITSPHAKKESGQTPYAVWSPLVQEFLGQGSGFDCCGVWFLFIFADSATTFADSARPNCQRSLTRLLLRVR